MAALLQGAEDAHQNGLGLGPVLAAVGVAVLPRNHGWSDLTFAVVVVERDFGMVQEREQLRAMPPKPLHQAARVALFPRPRQQFAQRIAQPLTSRCERFRGQLLPPLAQADRIADQALQLLGERRPVAAGLVVMLSSFQVAQQVRQALLFPAQTTAL